MKKTTRVLVALLALTLVTSCFVGGTFAKYVVSGPDATDGARVAKFGVEIAATGVMFNDSYKDEFTTYTEDETGKDITVQAASKGVDVVAPGTEGKLAAIEITGTPEVDVAVTYEADLALAGWEVEGAYYCPLEITVGSTTIKGTEQTDAAAFEKAVEDAIVALKQDYDTNTDLSVATADDVAISWAWAFEGNDNAKDTALGDAAAATIDLTITATVTQID